MPVTIGGGLSFCGRELKPEELDLIRQITREFATLSLTELAFTVCELLEWRRPNGGLKSPECYAFLQALHERGWLPWLSIQPKKLRPRSTEWDQQTDAQAPLTGPIGDYLPVQLQLLDNPDDRRLFRQYIQRYHYLGYKVPYGAQLRYFVRSLQPPCPLLACLLFTSAAWKMAPRDEHIGWSPATRQANLPMIVNHSRFLILPWVQVPNLASHILSLAARQLPRDWLAAYCAQPVLLETLVDGTRYHGGCYRAANWTEVGLTQGRGRMDRSGKAQGVRKHIFLFPLHRHWRERLCDPSHSLPRSIDSADEPAGNLR
jgi:Druantia protein DruA